MVNKINEIWEIFLENINLWNTNQTKIPEVKKKCEINNSIDEFNRLDTVEERFCKLEERSVEKIESDWTIGRKKRKIQKKSERHETQWRGLK